MLSHSTLATNALCLLAEGIVPEGSKGLLAVPMFHIAGIASMTALFMRGATHVVVPAFTPTGVLQAIERWRINLLLLVPTMIQMLVDHPEAASHDLSSVKKVSHRFVSACVARGGNRA